MLSEKKKKQTNKKPKKSLEETENKKKYIRGKVSFWLENKGKAKLNVPHVL